MSVRFLTLTLLSAAGAVLLSATPAAATPAFGTAAVSGGGSPDGAQVVVSSVTTGHHAGYDRVVFTLAGGMPHFDVGYLAEVREDPSDRPLRLLGGAYLRVVLRPTSTTVHAPQGSTTPGLPMLRQVAGAGDFEAVTSYGIGVAARSGFRAFTLTAPDRLVIDLAIPGAGPAGSADSGTTASPTTASPTTASATNGSAAAGSGTSGSRNTGWQRTGSGTADTGTAGSGGGLATTGASKTVPLVLGGLGLVGLGGAGLWLARRRRAV